ncbi:BgTH12-00630 [Blumeria graminis f. sp. triticale]|uniref:Bgt-5139 n=3 Tax=Blumeria graminis TaxID=34373 RepID=A0A061HD96_BLUGR|nr:Spore-specific water channel [Blumeria graminis f. sp. tritici 96224]CAD6505135.1 BgTH12-00630 [Blumeria graminis f. sp. triticale]VDB93135.1 Bgt-5139 [Blumeria graminis f. sp. tritici]
MPRHEEASDESRSNRSFSPAPQIPPIQDLPPPRSRSNPPAEIPLDSAEEVIVVQNRVGGLRRRPSNTPRRYSQTDLERPTIFEQSSRRRLRASSDLGRDEELHLDHPNHPDSNGRARPPRAHRNGDGWERKPGSVRKSRFEDTRLDLERGPDQWNHRRTYSIDDGSMETYNNDRINFKELSAEERAAALRLPWTQWMNSSIKNHFVATLGEFLGTTMFLFFGFAGAQVANFKPPTTSTDATEQPSFDITVYLYISMIFGFSLMVNVWIFYRISGALFNPAVTLAMTLVGAIPVVRAVLFPTPLNVRTSLSHGVSLVQGLFIEAILTAELVFTIFMLANEKHRATFLAPIGIGLALFIAQLVGVFYTGGSLNPARSLGPCVVTGTFESEHWIYWVGPFMGALIAVAFYKFIKLLEYEMANPGQDGDDTNDPTKNANKMEELRRRREGR